MGTVLVTGGTGRLGRHLVPLLESRGHEVRVLSRQPGSGTHVCDLSTGVGLDAALDGVDTVVHAASDHRGPGKHDPEHTRRIVSAGRGAQHLLYLSIVGIEDIPLGYYRRKLACESIVTSGEVPWTILRATQFHELFEPILRAVSRFRFGAMPLGLRFQPVAAAEVAGRTAALVDGPALGSTVSFCGPEVLALREMLVTWREVQHRRLPLMPLPMPGRVAAAFRAGRNTSPTQRDGTQTWREYLRGGR